MNWLAFFAVISICVWVIDGLIAITTLPDSVHTVVLVAVLNTILSALVVGMWPL